MSSSVFKGLLGKGRCRGAGRGGGGGLRAFPCICKDWYGTVNSNV